MSARTKKLHLKYLGDATRDGKPVWLVVSVNNSIDPTPNEILSKDRVKDIIELGLFEVVITGERPDA